ncbi:MAG: NYN domain-containing protein [Elainella sp. C42_A2020_010]|nr:NYN domain-containing protein [Elainella sp. C42_A2020_010]RNJ68735.1 MAG: NYN domain-containing protein [Leptolyngbya sp. IPPAS B-1204]
MNILPLKKTAPVKNNLPHVLVDPLPSAPSPSPSSDLTSSQPASESDPDLVCISKGFDRGRLIVLIDGSNLFYAALQLGIEIDYAKLLQCLTLNNQLVHAFFYTGVDPSNDRQQGFLSWMRHNGYRVVTKDMIQLADGSKKANLDVEIAVDMMRLAQYCDTIVLVSGDGDFAYAVKNLLYQGVRVEVVGLRSMTSNSLIDAADCYVDLNALRGAIQRFDKLSIETNPVSTASPLTDNPML